MDPQLIKNVLNFPIMVLMVLVFLIVISVLITNTIYYKKLWDENGSKTISEESAKVFFFINLFVAILSTIVFFVFGYRWYKLYNITNIYIESSPTISSSLVRTPTRISNPTYMTSPIGFDDSSPMYIPRSCPSSTMRDSDSTRIRFRSPNVCNTSIYRDRVGPSVVSGDMDSETAQILDYASLCDDSITYEVMGSMEE